jgi:ribosome-associated translation inhibitor RaiA
MTLVLDGLAVDNPLRTLITVKLEHLTRRGRRPPTLVRVAFTDENGPKGGMDTRCAITVELPRRPPLHASTVAGDPRSAFDGAVDTLERELERARGKRRDQARRPRKYYVAKQGLKPDGDAALPSPRWRRRTG